jgi:hypothetical protein
MSAGWVLVQTRDGAAPTVVDALARLDEVEMAEHTAGAYDVVARVRDGGPDVRTAKDVVQAALGVPGVTLAICCHDGGASFLDLTQSAQQVYPSEPELAELDGSMAGLPAGGSGITTL